VGLGAEVEVAIPVAFLLAIGLLGALVLVDYIVAASGKIALSR
jgi:hypothetical protein